MYNYVLRCRWAVIVPSPRCSAGVWSCRKDGQADGTQHGGAPRQTTLANLPNNAAPNGIFWRTNTNLIPTNFDSYWWCFFFHVSASLLRSHGATSPDLILCSEELLPQKICSKYETYTVLYSFRMNSFSLWHQLCHLSRHNITSGPEGLVVRVLGETLAIAYTVANSKGADRQSGQTMFVEIFIV